MLTDLVWYVEWLRQPTTSAACLTLSNLVMIFRRHPLMSSTSVCLYDHRLLRWSVSTSRPPPVYTTTVVRPWCHSMPRPSARVYCRRYCVNRGHVEQLRSWQSGTRLYDLEISVILDQLVTSTDCDLSTPSFWSGVRRRVSESQAICSPTRARVQWRQPSRRRGSISR